MPGRRRGCAASFSVSLRRKPRPGNAPRTPKLYRGPCCVPGTRKCLAAVLTVEDLVVSRIGHKELRVYGPIQVADEAGVALEGRSHLSVRTSTQDTRPCYMRAVRDSPSTCPHACISSRCRQLHICRYSCRESQWLKNSHLQRADR